MTYALDARRCGTAQTLCQRCGAADPDPAYDDLGFRPPGQARGRSSAWPMTEKQGVSTSGPTPRRGRASRTAATPLTGHKWFCSAPMCGRASSSSPRLPGGFLLPAAPRAPDGSRNACFIAAAQGQARQPVERLREIEYEDAFAWMVGEEGRGVPTIIEMVTHTRLDCVLAPAPSMRAAVVHACTTPPTARRSGLLVDQPLMRNVLADLAVESEAATTVALRLPRATDRRRAARARALLPAGAAGGQVLGMQASARARRRGAGMPGRQRLRRGVRHAQAVPGVAAVLHLGRLGERRRARRVARADSPAGLALRRSSPSSLSPRAPTAGWTRRSRDSARRPPTRRSHPPAASPRRWPSPSRRRC